MLLWFDTHKNTTNIKGTMIIVCEAIAFQYSIAAQNVNEATTTTTTTAAAAAATATATTTKEIFFRYQYIQSR